MKAFITGVTGYIGGDALYGFNQAHPEWELTCLVRNSDKGAKVAKAYPKVRLVYGDLDSVDLIEEEARRADVVFHFANCDHEPSAHAIAKGLATSHTHTSPSNPAFWIHTSGTGMLAHEDLSNRTFGAGPEPTGRNRFDDGDSGIGKIRHQIPDPAPHRLVDKIVWKVGTDPETAPRVKTAIVCPPTIYGPGRGPDNRRSIQAYGLASAMLEARKGLVVGEGKNVWTQVHVWDLSMLYLRLGEAAAAELAAAAAATGTTTTSGEQREGSKATWGEGGYYFAENGEFVWGSIAAAIALDAYKKGFLESPDLTSLPGEEAQKYRPMLQFMVGSNSECKAIRARELLGWKPKERTLIEEVPDIVDEEARRLGLTRSHAEKVAA